MKFLFDIFPLVLFFGAYKLYGIYVATATAMANIEQVRLFKLNSLPVVPVDSASS